MSEKKNIGWIILIVVLALIFLGVSIGLATRNGDSVAETGKLVLYLIGLIGGYFLGKTINNNVESKTVGIVIGIVFLISCVIAAESKAAYFIGLIATIIFAIAIVSSRPSFIYSIYPSLILRRHYRKTGLDRSIR